jgi:predicted solute-binding protein
MSTRHQSACKHVALQSISEAGVFGTGPIGSVILEETKKKLNSRNACDHSYQNFLSSRLLKIID